ncbi:hypothetical protein L2E82_19535 [Cichorium intybus]|uniref:Uncharacterized protein n=1 Tax=Cichorium intybus TaxID=13427 RepID=A0ACB9FC40_CICIN|nr:hypothetical protein L2E82_19535 [Cichorium intybus]
MRQRQPISGRFGVIDSIRVQLEVIDLELSLEPTLCFCSWILVAIEQSFCGLFLSTLVGKLGKYRSVPRHRDLLFR